MARSFRVARFRNSLAFKVIFSTLLLCLGVVWLTGSALYAQLSDGIRKVKVESSVAEARSAIFNAQYRIILAEDSEAKAIKQIVDDIIVNSPSVIGTAIIGREVALLRTMPTSNGAIDYQRTSNQMLISSIPKELRIRVQKSISTEWSETVITYLDGSQVPALAVGEKITIPKAGAYEMYLLFDLTSQNATLALLSRALLVTGLALILMITLITSLVVRQIVRPVREAARIAEGFTAGELSQRMRIRGKDEIARLGNAFNEMALSLQNQITRLENLSRVQQRFVSDVSHELRTPLTLEAPNFSLPR
jgi:two-component system sensor histidine kinase MtrB